MSVDTHVTGKREQTRARNRGLLLAAARDEFVGARDLLLRIVAVLVQMVRRIAESGTGSGTE